MNAHLLLKCMNPNCSHEFHLAEVENIEEDSQVPNELFIVRLNRKTVRLLNTLADSDTVNKVTQQMGKKYYTEERQGMTHLSNIPYANLNEVISIINAIKASADYSTTTVGQVNTSKDVEHKLVDYTPELGLSNLENAQARLTHYRSEVIRLQAIELLKTLNS